MLHIRMLAKTLACRQPQPQPEKKQDDDLFIISWKEENSFARGYLHISYISYISYTYTTNYIIYPSLLITDIISEDNGVQVQQPHKSFSLCSSHYYYLVTLLHPKIVSGYLPTFFGNP